METIALEQDTTHQWNGSFAKKHMLPTSYSKLMLFMFATTCNNHFGKIRTRRQSPDTTGLGPVLGPGLGFGSGLGSGSSLGRLCTYVLLGAGAQTTDTSIRLSVHDGNGKHQVHQRNANSHALQMLLLHSVSIHAASQCFQWALSAGFLSDNCHSQNAAKTAVPHDSASSSRTD